MPQLFNTNSPCAICGGPPSLEPGSMALIPKAWAHTSPCVLEFKGDIWDLGNEICGCDASRSLASLGGSVVQPLEGVPADELWFAAKDRITRYRITKDGLELLPDLPKGSRPNGQT